MKTILSNLCLLAIVSLTINANVKHPNNTNFLVQQISNSRNSRFNVCNTPLKKVSDNLNERDYSNVIQLIESYINEFPEKSESEIADLVYEDLFIKKKSYGNITIAEFNVVLRTLGIFGFFTVNEIATQVTNTTIAKYGYNGHKDDLDAFRHIYLTAMLYDEISKQFSIDLMLTHESESPGGVDRQMDLHNNDRGISLYELWIDLHEPVPLEDFISHCVSNGHFYNIIKVNDFNTIVFTDTGLDNPSLTNNCIVDLSKYNKNSFMKNGDFQWYIFNSGNKMGTFNVSSSSNLDLIVELHSSYSKENNTIDFDDDDGLTNNFSLNFEMTYDQTIYIKVSGFNDSQNGDYQINITEVDVSCAPTVRYLRYDKKKHIKIDASGNRTTESHVVRSTANRHTNCIYCFESLDLLVDGPFRVLDIFRKNIDAIEIS